MQIYLHTSKKYITFAPLFWKSVTTKYFFNQLNKSIMKKIFSLFAAVLFASSMMAGGYYA